MEKKLSDTLDANNPNWWNEWATGQELIDFAKAPVRDNARKVLKERVGARLFHSILHAAIEAGIVTSNIE